jgi:hypothetical protein
VQAHVAEPAAHVVERRGKAMPGRQPIGDRDGGDAVAREVERVPGRLARVTVDPGPSVDEDDTRREAGGLLGR